MKTLLPLPLLLALLLAAPAGLSAQDPPKPTKPTKHPDLITRLREVDRLQVAEIRRSRGIDATTRFGSDHGHGAILVKLR